MICLERTNCKHNAYVSPLLRTLILTLHPSRGIIFVFAIVREVDRQGCATVAEFVIGVAVCPHEVGRAAASILSCIDLIHSQWQIHVFMNSGEKTNSIPGAGSNVPRIARRISVGDNADDYQMSGFTRKPTTKKKECSAGIPF